MDSKAGTTAAANHRRVGLIWLVRSFHITIAACLLGCIVYIYYCGLTGRVTTGACLACGALVAEGVGVVVCGRRCPLVTLHRKFGDNRSFFDLFLPRAALPYAYPTLAGVAMFGMVLLVI